MKNVHKNLPLAQFKVFVPDFLYGAVTILRSACSAFGTFEDVFRSRAHVILSVNSVEINA